MAKEAPMSLEERLKFLRTRILRKPLTLDEQAWLIDACDALRRQGEQLIYQAESQIVQFNDVVNVKGLEFPDE